MHKLNLSARHLLPLLLLLPALALGPIGCGPELVVAAPVVLKAVAVVLVAAEGVHQLQKVEAGRLDVETKEEQLRQLRQRPTPVDPYPGLGDVPVRTTTLPVYYPPGLEKQFVPK